jgi:hypothetical protein
MSDKPLKDPFRSVIDRMMSTFAEHQWEMLLRSYCLAMRDEQKARLRTVLELAVELDTIKKTSNFGTAFHEQCIEAIIKGDWKDAAQVNRWLGDPESGDNERFLALWEKFRAIVTAACAEAAKREKGIRVEPD